MTEVIMPKMGDGMEEGTLVEWLKKEGDTVKSGEVVANIQTDKATLEMESPGAGVLSGIIVQAGQTVPVGTPIAAILGASEKLPEGWGSGAAPKPKAEPVTASAAVSQPQMEVATRTEGRTKASPLAKKIAKELGVDLAALAGTGPGGRIVEKDVRSSRPAPAAKQAVVAGDRNVPLTPLRRITAQRTQQSKQQAPHFYVTVAVDVERIMALRDFFKEEASGSVSVNDFVLLATARALRDMPEVNASFADDHVVEHGAVNIGMAVAVPDGLTVAVLKGVDQMGLRELSEASRELAARARDNKLGLDELGGSTFSVSNMGMLDVENFAAIINGPNAGILAVGTAKRTVVAVDDENIEVRWQMKLTGSFDHRVVDGAVGARFVNAVRGYLESPTRLLS